jgi:hypothetical protein
VLTAALGEAAHDDTGHLHAKHRRNEKEEQPGEIGRRREASLMPETWS